MDKSNTNIDYLIGASLSGKITKEELDVLNAWKDANPENAAELNQYKCIWKRSCALKLFKEIDSKNDWKKVKTCILKTKTKKLIKYNFKPLRRIAAILLPTILVTGIAFSLYWTTPGFGRWTIAKASNNTLEVTLPDSSVILLNKHSDIRYLSSFKESAVRRVQLNGEAFFNVIHKKHKPFIVVSKDIKISVLGTKFNVKQQDNDVYVSVLSGMVKLNDTSKNSILLTNGEKGVYKKNRLSEINNKSLNDLYWYTGKLSFNHASLEEICSSLQKAYPEIKVIKNTTNKSKIRITTSFYKQSLKDVIEELHIHFRKNFVFDGKTLTISD